MNISLQVRLYTETRTNQKGHVVEGVSWLCFKHAIARNEAGEIVCLEVDDFGEYYGGPTSCVDCHRSEARTRLGLKA